MGLDAPGEAAKQRLAQGLLGQVEAVGAPALGALGLDEGGHDDLLRMGHGFTRASRTDFLKICVNPQNPCESVSHENLPGLRRFASAA